MTRARWNHHVAMNERRDVLHLRVKLCRPVWVVVLLFFLTWRRFGPNTVNQPHRVRRVREIPLSQCRVEMGRVDRVYTNRIGSHLRHQRDPLLVRAVVGRKLRGELPWQSGPQVDCLDPHRRPLTVSCSDFYNSPPRSCRDSCHRRSHMWSEGYLVCGSSESSQIVQCG